MKENVIFVRCLKRKEGHAHDINPYYINQDILTLIMHTHIISPNSNLDLFSFDTFNTRKHEIPFVLLLFIFLALFALTGLLLFRFRFL